MAGFDSANAPTREKILLAAADLFAQKGYSETTVRELSAAIGVKASSIYYHFPSKNAILMTLIEEYLQTYASALDEQDMFAKLSENPTSDGVLSCHRLLFPAGKEAYYLKVMCVLLQEQHRDPVIRKFIADHFIKNAEKVVEKIIKVLKDLNIIRKDTDPDYWAKSTSGLMYTFSNRFMLGIGDSAPDYTGMGMNDMLKTLYDMMLNTCGVVQGGDVS